MEELLRYQDTLNELLQSERNKLVEADGRLQLEQLCSRTRTYVERLQHVRKQMQQLQEQSTKLRKRALRLQQEKQEQALQTESALEQQMQRDKHLMPVVMNKQVKK